MFGYITPFKPEMKICDWDTYKSYYCGLCHEIKHSYGNVARFALNYDFVTLALLADALSTTPVNIASKRCMASPFVGKQVQVSTDGLFLAGGGLAMSAYYKLADDAQDEGFVKKQLASLLQKAFKKSHRKSAKAFEQADLTMQSQMALQAELEKRSSTNPDEAAEPTAQMTACLFALAGESEIDKQHLFRLGYMLGKIIYLLDAAEDYDEDKKDGKYNVFSSLSKENCIAQATQLCRLCHSDITLSYKKLPIELHKDILDNIIYLGINKSISMAGTKRKSEKGRT